jgi:YD repeat-containing protein
MRRLFIFLALLLSCLGVVTGQGKPGRERAGFRGVVRTVRVERAGVSTTSEGLVESPRVVLAINSYDKNGNTTQQTVNNSNGSRKWKYGWSWVYDGRGREMRRNYYNDVGMLTSTGISTYDDDRHKAEVTQYNPNGSVNHIREIFFDDKGNTVREIFRYPSGEAYEHLFGYDEQGNLIEEILQDGQGNVVSRNVWTYDDHGNQIELIIHKPEGPSLRMFKRLLSYDGSGNIVEQLNYRTDGSPGSKETFSYEFDAQGNWTRRNTVRELVKAEMLTRESEVTYRSITYF